VIVHVRHGDTGVILNRLGSYSIVKRSVDKELRSTLSVMGCLEDADIKVCLHSKVNGRRNVLNKVARSEMA